MNYYTFSVAWPAPALRPNRRHHHMAIARAKKIARAEAFYEAKAAGLREAEKAHIHFTFHPHPGTPPDDDNCTASVKAHIDGIADALGMNDLHITKSYAVSPEFRKGGAVVVNVSIGDMADMPLKGTIS